MMKDSQQKLKTAIFSYKASIPVLCAYLPVGIVFGVLLKGIGFGFPYALFMSFFVYSGTLSYVGIELISTGATIISTFVLSLFVNLRYAFYSIAMIEKFKEIKYAKLHFIHGQVDETFAIVNATTIPDDINKDLFYFFVDIFDHSYWIISVLIGNIIGNLIPPEVKGLDFAMTAVFSALFLEQWESNDKNHIPAITGVVSTIICLIIFKRDYFVLPSLILITIILLFYRKELEQNG